MKLFIAFQYLQVFDTFIHNPDKVAAMLLITWILIFPNTAKGFYILVFIAVNDICCFKVEVIKGRKCLHAILSLR